MKQCMVLTYKTKVTILADIDWSMCDLYLVKVYR